MPSDAKPYDDRQLETILSTERFARYLAWADGDRARAVELYALNTALSEALYTPLQMLEVGLRNQFHTALSEAHGPAWFDAPGLLVVPHQLEQRDKAKAELVRAGRPVEPGRVVAALTLGFWTALVNKDYEGLWRATLHRAARSEEGRRLDRKALSRPLQPLRELRNRVAHHEPILHWDLPKHYERTLQITGWLSPAAAAWTRAHSRFLDVHPPGRIALGPGLAAQVPAARSFEQWAGIAPARDAPSGTPEPEQRPPPPEIEQ